MREFVSKRGFSGVSARIGINETGSSTTSKSWDIRTYYAYE